MPFQITHFRTGFILIGKRCELIDFKCYCGMEVKSDLTRCGGNRNSQTSSIWNWTGIEERPRQLMRRGRSSILISNRLFLLVLCLPPREGPPLILSPILSGIVFWPRLESTSKRAKGSEWIGKFGIKSQKIRFWLPPYIINSGPEN